ncbi:PPE family protein [Mycobacterium sp. M1]|uniref:PPE family protein n=1 Tax=Mycolicibacter acidiphilus TaxID=2835306 RepID=A0ABS5REF4_9MYCO|nr:PPE family protein [Mycolicibacter acidiphilus]MBS9532666.1 PPE family protein [Mycolicibacter acidiphilus]
MDFGAQSPEVNSGRIYAGPGSASLRTAAAGWTRLATELGSAAAGYQAVIAELGQTWLGPAAEAMTAAAAPYAAWLRTTAVQVEQTATQAETAADVFEQAFAAMVPPTVIAANRSELAALIAADAFGQNAAAIAALEAEYGQMWVQDATVMYGYAGQSAAAAAVPPFTAPPTVADPSGQAGQAAATAQSATGTAHSQLSQLMGSVPQTLHGLSSNSGSAAAPPDVSAPVQSTEPPSASQAASYIEMISRSILPANDTNISTLYGMGQYSRNLNTDLDIAAATDGKFGFGSGNPAPPPAPLPSVRPAVAASVGDTATVGKLSVPSAWTAAAPEVAMTAAALPATAPGAAPIAGPAGLGADAAAAGIAGRALAAGAAGAARHRPGADARRLERIAGELTGTRAVQRWHTDSGGRRGLLGELSRRPGVHEVHFDSEDPDPQPQQG